MTRTFICAAAAAFMIASAVPAQAAVAAPGLQPSAPAPAVQQVRWYGYHHYHYGWHHHHHHWHCWWINGYRRCGWGW